MTLDGEVNANEFHTEHKDVLIARADEQLARVRERIASADEEIARVTEQLSKWSGTMHTTLRPDPGMMQASLGQIRPAATARQVSSAWLDRPASHRTAVGGMPCRRSPRVAVVS